MNDPYDNIDRESLPPQRPATPNERDRPLRRPVPPPDRVAPQQRGPSSGTWPAQRNPYPDRYDRRNVPPPIRENDARRARSTPTGEQPASGGTGGMPPGGGRFGATERHDVAGPRDGNGSAGRSGSGGSAGRAGSGPATRDGNGSTPRGGNGSSPRGGNGSTPRGGDGSGSRDGAVSGPRTGRPYDTPQRDARRGGDDHRRDGAAGRPMTGNGAPSRPPGGPDAGRYDGSGRRSADGGFPRGTDAPSARSGDVRAGDAGRDRRRAGEGGSGTPGPLRRPSAADEATGQWSPPVPPSTPRRPGPGESGRHSVDRPTAIQRPATGDLPATGAAAGAAAGRVDRRDDRGGSPGSSTRRPGDADATRRSTAADTRRSSPEQTRRGATPDQTRRGTTPEQTRRGTAEPTRRSAVAGAAAGTAAAAGAAGAAAASTRRVAHGPDRPLSASDRSASDRSASDRSASDRSASGRSASDLSASDDDQPRAYSATTVAASSAGTRTGERSTGGTPPPRPPDDSAQGSGDGSGGGRRRLPRGRTIRRLLVAALLLCLVLPAAALVIAYLVSDVPEPGELQTNQIATIVAADGTTELSRVVPPEGNRTDVPIDQVPEYVRTAVLSAEDRNFYNNPGFSIMGFTRAARDQILGRDNAGGGSTITQQYVKNVLVGSAPTLQRKLHELVLSAKMAREWSKDEILSAYLNTIYFGRGAYGIAAASQAYFGKPVNELTLPEGAVLAATIQLPSELDPETNPEGAQARWNYVLDGMVDMGALSQTDRDAQLFPQVVPAGQVAAGSPLDEGPNGLIKTQVLAELAAEGISEQEINTAGLQITTAIRPDAQAELLESVETNMQGEPEDLRTAAVSIDPKTGAIAAYYGGSDGHGFDFAQSGLQTGSSFKVFALAAGLAQGIPLSQQFDSSELTVNGIEISNVEGASCGTCSIAEALKRSLNTSFYRLELSLDNGPQDIADMAHNAGVARELPGIGPTLTEPNDAGPNNGIVLGQYQSRVLDMASAYATFAASGTYHKPYFVQKVVAADGRVLLDRGAGQPGEQVIDEDVANNVTSAMEPIAAYSRGHGLAGGRPSAAKTGTAQLGDTGNNKDAWMVGFTPSLSTAVWVGTEQSLPLVNYAGASIYGSGLPSDIWKDAMDGMLSGTDVESFPTPGSIGGQAGRPVSEPSSSSSSEDGESQNGTGGGGTQTAPAQQVPQYQVPSLPAQPPAQVPSEVEILPGVTIQIPGASAPASQPIPTEPGAGAAGTGTENRTQREEDTGNAGGGDTSGAAGADPEGAVSLPGLGG